jgi:dipeptidyl aminopeptidase/acylaminoacyl peptidase
MELEGLAVGGTAVDLPQERERPMTSIWRRSNGIVIGVLAALLCSCSAEKSAQAQDQALIPRSVFFGNPDKAMVKVSPDGSRLSFLAPHNDVLNVWVQTVGEDDAKPVTNATTRPIRNYFWAHNNNQIIYLQDRAGDENFHLYAVDLDAGEERDLTPYDNVQARFLASDRSFPDEILVMLNNRQPALHDVWRINTVTGEAAMITQNDDGFAGFGADADFNVRLASRIRKPDGALQSYTRPGNAGPWNELATWSNEDAANSGPLEFTRDGKTLYVLDSRGVNTAELHAYNFGAGADGAGTYTLVTRNDKADINDVITDPATGKVQAAGSQYTRRQWTILDEAIQKDWDYLRSIAEGDLMIGSRSEDDRTWIVSYTRDDGPVEYYLYDRPAKNAKFLFTNRSQLENLKLAKMKPVVVQARDGMDLVAYFTLPPSGPSTNLPMVLLVHGGPWARDSWGYNTLHQWLANRGYAVMSVNFRGSTGFGKQFMNAGNREWAAKMHDDLIDAVNWAVSERIADPARVAIMGGSYGGYATLVGLTFTPDFFACGVDIVGPSHVRTLLETIPPYWEPIKAMFETRVGRLDEPEFLDQISPLTKVDAIRKPLLIGQGKNDPRVKESESIQIVNAMQAKGLPVTYVVFPDEGHGFARPENNTAFFAITEAFLAKHLGGRYEPIGSSVRASTAEIGSGAELIPGLTDSDE